MIRIMDDKGSIFVDLKEMRPIIIQADDCCNDSVEINRCSCCYRIIEVVHWEGKKQFCEECSMTENLRAIIENRTEHIVKLKLQAENLAEIINKLSKNVEVLSLTKETLDTVEENNKKADIEKKKFEKAKKKLLKLF